MNFGKKIVNFTSSQSALNLQNTRSCVSSYFKNQVFVGNVMLMQSSINFFPLRSTQKFDFW